MMWERLPNDDLRDLLSAALVLIAMFQQLFELSAVPTLLQP
jgi:hypothetical protein